MSLNTNDGKKTPQQKQVQIQKEDIQTREKRLPRILHEYLTDDIDNCVANGTHQTFIHHCHRVSHIPLLVTYHKAIASPESTQWRETMDEEIFFVLRSEHIDVRYQVIRDEVHIGFANLFHIPVKENPTDMFTNPVSKGKLE
ncbi:hypothetical protein SK128_005312 [Halocaridina rubra]|uniref:Uncharacterized protein n=1 Tax=Halocaridina rubra TaxID=373956 RepID=A0AAN8ZT51_HALRR